ncbi:hypothetical protein NP233_g9720 [Leucocoprinus birnbaumii]|uniref:NACHT domain-containing protein n=1 Tax=Leucocoprinus birnbaumii TaxID=56174 RepID=A0AAD5VJP5_9AGAR|nr:hypothetical protein NP233_g9720 [Leucocoprinus birnbaumii]
MAFPHVLGFLSPAWTFNAPQMSGFFKRNAMPAAFKHRSTPALSLSLVLYFTLFSSLGFSLIAWDNAFGTDILDLNVSPIMLPSDVPCSLPNEISADVYVRLGRLMTLTHAIDGSLLPPPAGTIRLSGLTSLIKLLEGLEPLSQHGVCQLCAQSAASSVTRSRFERSQTPSFLRVVLPDHRLDTSNMTSQPDESAEERAVRIPEVKEGFSLSIKIWKSHTFREHEMLAEAEIPFIALWTYAESNTSEDTIPLFDIVDLKVANLKLSLAVGIDSLRSAKVEIRAVKEKLQRMTTVFSSKISSDSTALVVDLTAEVLGVIGVVHPAVKLAVKLVKTAVEKAQLVADTKEKMEKLVNDLMKMADCVFIVKEKEFAKVQMLKDVLKSCPEVMSKAVDLIQKWLESNFKFLDSWVNDLKSLETELLSLKEDFDRGLFVDLTINFAESKAGADLKEDLLQGKALGPKSLRRRFVLWMGKNLIWVTGYPGSGKSTLAASIMRLLGQIAFYFRFDRNNSQAATPQAMWREVAYMLASRDPALRKVIQECLFDITFNRGTADVEEIFARLVKKPLFELPHDIQSTHLPVLVIDAIDEWNELRTRKALLATLRELAELTNSRVKVVIFSRREEDIREAFSELQLAVIEIPTGDAAKEGSDADSDIEKYLRSCLSECEKDFPGFSQAVKNLARRSAGVFQWAKTAADMLLPGPLSEDLLELILRPEGDGDDGPLFSLYSKLLESRLPNLRKLRELSSSQGSHAAGKAAVYKKEFRGYQSVLAAMTRFNEPLIGTNEQCAQLLGVDGRVVSGVRKCLSSILNPDSLSFGHKSFVDFLTLENRQCPPELFVDTQLAKEAEQQLAFRCLAIMLDDADKGHGLRFNICCLETSAKTNKDFSDLAVKIQSHIPPHLSYSCRFWAQHLVACEFDEALLGKANALFRTKLLYWLEVMSLLGEINRIPSIMRSILDWAKGGKDTSFVEMVQDALRFVLAFHEPIAQSAPHIYISALPFTPRESAVSQYYLKHFPCLLHFHSGEPLRWAPLASSIAINSSSGATIKRIAFSPDSWTYATIKYDSNSITVRELETDTVIAGPFVHPSTPCSVEFSPDKEHILVDYANGNLVIWDTQGGNQVSSFNLFNLGYLSDIQERSTTVSYCNRGRTVSVDVRIGPISEGQRRQRLIFLLNADNLGSGAKLLSEILPKDERPLEVADVISFSPISSYVAVGRSCADRVVEIGLWDISDGRHVHTFRLGDCNPIVHLEFSSDGRHLLIGSLNGRENCVMELDTKAVCVLLIANDVEAPVIAMTYVSEARLLIRISKITIMIWDLRTGKTVFSNLVLEGQIINGSFHENGSAFSIAVRSPGGVGIRVQTYDFSNWAGMEGPVILASPPSTSQSNLDAILRPWLPEGWRLAKEINPEDREYPYRVQFYDTNGVQRAGAFSHIFQQTRLSHLEWNVLPHYVDMCTLLAGNSESSESDPASPASQNRVIISPSGRLRVFFDNYGPHSETEGIRFLHDGIHDIPSTTTSIKLSGPVRLVPSLPEEESTPWTISPDDRLFAYFSASDQAVWVHDTLTVDLVFGPWHVKNCKNIGFSEDGTKIITTSSSGNFTHVWDISDQSSGSAVPIGDFGDDLPIREDGWVAKRDGDLLIWVPEQMREGLYRPRNLLVVNHDEKKEDYVWGTELDLKEFRHGKRWNECYDPQE